MLYNVVLVSAIHQHEWAIGVHMSPPSLLPPHPIPLGCHRAPDWAPWVTPAASNWLSVFTQLFLLLLFEACVLNACITDTEIEESRFYIHCSVLHNFKKLMMSLEIPQSDVQIYASNNYLVLPWSMSAEYKGTTTKQPKRWDQECELSW